MKKIILNYFIKHYNLISKECIQEFIDLARENERNSVVAKYEQKIMDEKERLNNEHFFTMQEKDAEINRLYREVADLNENLKKSETVYYKSVQRAKKNFRITAEIKFLAQKHMDTTITSFQSIQRLYDDAECHYNEIADEEEKDKHLLGLERKKIK